MATSTEVHFTLACLLHQHGVRFKPEVYLPSRRMRSGRFKADLALTDPSGNPYALIECKGWGRKNGPNTNGRQYKNYAEAGLPFTYCHAKNISETVEWARNRMSENCLLTNVTLDAIVPSPHRYVMGYTSRPRLTGSHLPTKPAGSA